MKLYIVLWVLTTLIVDMLVTNIDGHKILGISTLFLIVKWLIPRFYIQNYVIRYGDEWLFADNFMYQDDQLRANTVVGGSVSMQNIKAA